MRKYFFIMVIVAIAAAMNVVFWLWVRSDNGDVALIAAQNSWLEYSDGALVSFQVPAELNREGEPAVGVYWFGAKKQGQVAIFYGRFSRATGTLFKNQFEAQILAGGDCTEKQDKATAAYYRGCDFQGAKFAIIGFEKADVMAALAVNIDYFNKNDANFILNSLEK